MNRAKNRYLGPIQLIAGSQAGGCANVAEKHVGFLNSFQRQIERPGNGFFDQPFPQTDPQIAGQNLDQVLPSRRRDSFQSLLEKLRLADRTARSMEIFK